MGKPTGFLEHPRAGKDVRPARERPGDFREIYADPPESLMREQGARCMDCGVPFCQADPGCPVDNLIPEWNDQVYRGDWKGAWQRLRATNNFPEFTGRICPAPCESACVLGINDDPVTIRAIERAIADRAFAEGWEQPYAPAPRTGQKVAVVGSGPAGLAAADQLNRAGHSVEVFERDDRIGGLMTYGVPNMKLDKRLVQRRADLLAAGGVVFRTGIDVDADRARDLRRHYDAVLLACGALAGRDLDLPGRSLPGVDMAMDYLTAATRHLLDGLPLGHMDVVNRQVVVIGGGDTGTDCIATALRQGAASVVNITRRQADPSARDRDHPWPGPPGTLVIDYGHEEAAAMFGEDPRRWGIQPLAFLDDGNGRLGGIGCRVTMPDGEVTERELPADQVFLSVGFTGHDVPELVEALGISDDAGRVVADETNCATSVPGIYVAGDMRRGASLIVWAIAEGRQAAASIDRYLDPENLKRGQGLKFIQENQVIGNGGF